MPNKIIAVENDVVFFNKYYKPLYHQCDHTERTKHNPYLPPISYRCGRDSMYLVTLKGELTGEIFNLHLCEVHAQPFIKYLETGE